MFKIRTDQSILQIFYPVSRETTDKTLKTAASKKIFSGLYVIGITCFDEYILFYVITGRYYFSQKFMVVPRFFNGHVFIFFGESALKDVRNLYVISTITVRF